MEVVSRIEKEAECKINDWVVYINTDTHPAHYTLAVETDDGRDMSIYSEKAETDMCEINPIYTRFRHNIVINPMTVVNQVKGTHAAWKQSKIDKGVAPTQVKLVRVLDNKEKYDFFLNRLVKEDGK